MMGATRMLSLPLWAWATKRTRMRPSAPFPHPLTQGAASRISAGLSPSAPSPHPLTQGEGESIP
jgi:hypothetical protein